MNLEDKLEEKKVELRGKSDAGRKISKFESIDLSDEIFDIIRRNQSYRFVFNYILKHGSFSQETELSRIKSNLRSEIKDEKSSIADSFVVKTNCRCGEEIKDNVWGSKRNKCPNCGLELHNWEETTKVEDQHIENLIGRMEDQGVLIRQVNGHCINCNVAKRNISISSSDNAEKLMCSECEEILNTEMVFGIPNEASNLESQGYWLEWYMKSILKEEFGNSDNTKNSMKYVVKDGEDIVNGGEIDVVSLITGAEKIATVSCYDTHGKVTASKFQEILQFTEISDMVIFCTTGQINRDSCKHILDRVEETDLILVEGDQIENIGNLIRERLVEEFSSHLKNENMDKVSSYLYLYSYSYSDSEKEKLVAPAVKLAQEDLVEFIKTFAIIDYRDFRGFPEDVAAEISQERIKRDGNEVFSLLESDRWERIALSTIFLRNAYSELAKADKETFVSKLEELSKHRSVFVREEVIKTVSEIYDNSPDSLEGKLDNIILRLSDDGTYIESKAKSLTSKIDLDITDHIVECDYCDEIFPEENLYETHLMFEHDRAV